MIVNNNNNEVLILINKINEIFKDYNDDEKFNIYI
jgi:hypothetical protein